ncbi:MAG: adenylate/guanylate cyclase domain-containing protein [Planctomycetota bacterium]
MYGVFQITYMLGGVPQTFESSKREVQIGRSKECELCLPHESVSRVHATIVGDGAGWTVTDQNSRNGIYLASQRVQQHRLRHNDVLVLGSVEIRFLVASSPPNAEAADVRYHETVHDHFLSQTINVASFKERLSGPSTHDTRTSDGKVEAKPAVAAFATDSASWAIPLYNKAVRALISSNSLDEMLGTVVDLVFDSLPAEHACVFLHDEKTGERLLKIMRTKAGGRGGTESFSVSSTVLRQVIDKKDAVLVIDSLSDAALSSKHSIVMNQICSIVCAPMMRDDSAVEGLIYADTRSRSQPFSKQHLEALTTLALLSGAAVERARLRERIQEEQRIRQRLARYSAPSVVEQIVRSSATDAAGEMMAEEREVSVLFLDLVNFTGLTEQLEPKEVSRLLNGIFGELCQCAFAEAGTLDKFTGDGLMAIFGAPLPQADHAIRAVRAALSMQAALANFNRERSGASPLAIRIGINSGNVIAGDIGTTTRRDYTVIGDTVNVASRLESQIARPGQIVVGPYTYERVEPFAICRQLGSVPLKGKQREVDAYLVEGLKPTPA